MPDLKESPDLAWIPPDFKNDHQLWFYIWRTINFQWEKEWSKKTEDTPAWWLGMMAGRLFRFRELSGLEDGYCHGSLTTGSWAMFSEKGRRFQDNEFEIRKRTHASLARPDRFVEL